MNCAKTIERTEKGYSYNGLEAIGLAPQESRALLLRAAGNSIADCAKILGCSNNNVSARLNNLFFKLRVNSTSELIGTAFKTGALRTLMLLAALHCVVAMPSLSENNEKVARIVRISKRHRREFDHA